MRPIPCIKYRIKKGQPAPKEAVALGGILLDLGAMYFELFPFALCPMLFAQYPLRTPSPPRPHKKTNYLCLPR